RDNAAAAAAPAKIAPQETPESVLDSCKVDEDVIIVVVLQALKNGVTSVETDSADAVPVALKIKTH
ncbi:MAG: hypothetical protein RR726_37190, partial [Pseudomonas sp.]